MKRGWSAISHDLTAKFAEIGMSGKALALALLVARKSFGNGRRESGTLETKWLAEMLRITEGHVRRIVRVLLAGKILQEQEPPRRLRPGERCLGIQFEDLAVWHYEGVDERERKRDLPLFAACTSARAHRARRRVPTVHVGACPPCTSERHKSEPFSTSVPPRKLFKKDIQEAAADDDQHRDADPRASSAAAAFLKIEKLARDEADALGLEAARAFGDEAPAFAAHCAAEVSRGTVEDARRWIGKAIASRWRSPKAPAPKKGAPAEGPPPEERARTARLEKIRAVLRELVQHGDHVRFAGRKTVWIAEWTSSGACSAFAADGSAPLGAGIDGTLLDVVSSEQDIRAAVVAALDINRHERGNPMDQLRQGDLLFIRLPKRAKKAKPNPSGHVLAFGEATGHSHAILEPDLKNADVFLDEDGRLIVRAKADTRIGHEEHGLPHEDGRVNVPGRPIQLDADDWEVRRQREYEPAGWRRVAD